MPDVPTERLYHLLPAIYQQRDLAQGEPLRALMAILESQLQLLESDMAALYDNWFIETCEPWAIPYIGDVLNVYGLSDAQNVIASQRMRVANTIRYRRRKGLTAVVERVIREATNWYARGVVFRDLLAMTQHVQHVRAAQGRTADVRQQAALAALDGPFEQIAHTIDVRSLAPDPSSMATPTPRGTRRGKFNLPHMGIFLWRLQPYTTTNLAAPVAGHAGAYMAHPLGLDTLLFNRPQKPALTEASDVIHVPQPLTCEALAADLRACPLPSNNPPVSQVTPDNSPRYYGPQRSLSVAMVTHMTHTPINPAYVASLALATWQVDWSHPALQRLAVAIDVSRGRLLLNLSQDQMRQLVASGAQVEVTYTYGFSAAMGGGPYRRPLPSATAAPTWTATVDAALAQSSPPEQRYKSLSEAVTAWHNAASDLGLIRILSSAVCDEPNGVGITIPPQGALIIEAPQGQRACLQGNLTVQVAGGVSATAIAAPPERSLTLSGLLIQGQVRLKNDLSLVLTHSTLIPSPSQDSLSWQPDSGSDTGLNLQVLIAHSIVGWVCLPETARSLTVTDSIMTGCAGHTLGATPSVFGPPTTLTNTTVLGPMYVQAIPQALNVIFRQAVTTQRRQVGSLRFSYVPPDAATQSPRLFRCQPALALAEVSDAAEQTRLRTRVQPVFTSTVYGQPGYGQLSQLCPAEITQGGEGDSEMGAFNSLHQPRRQRNLHAALDEYLGVDFASGVFYVT